MEQEELKVDPQRLRAEAEKEPRRRGLGEYWEPIRVLKEEKGFSLREIAAWLRERGLNVDHNAVWRTYSKGTQERRPIRRSEQIERYERKGVGEGAMPWL